MPTAPVNQRRWSRFGLLFLAAVLCYALLTFLGWMLGAVVVKRFPENYDWQVRTAIRNGNFEKAEAVARSRVQKEHYDFNAQRLLASVLLEAGKPNESVEVLISSLDRMATAEGRDVYTIGADPFETYEMLSEALRRVGRDNYAAEAAAIAADYRNIAAFTDQRSTLSVELDRTTTVPPIAGSGTELPLDTFRLNGGVSLSTSGTLHFAGNGSAEINLGAFAGKSSALALQLAGTKALGVGAILKVALGDKELFRAYAPAPHPRWVVIPLENIDQSSSQVLTLGFINDAFDPVTKSDRNVEVLKVIIN